MVHYPTTGNIPRNVSSESKKIGNYIESKRTK
jgi:hypothetical protein